MKIREIRKKNNLTQNDVAKFLGISSRTYANYENEFTQPDINLLIRLSDFYNVSVDYLIGHRQNNKIDKSGLTDTQKNIIDIASQLNEIQANRVESYAIAKLEEQQDMKQKYKLREYNETNI